MGAVPSRGAAQHGPLLLAPLAMPSASPSPTNRYAWQGAVLLLWVLAAWNSYACRGLFWDGAAFLVNIVDFDKFHDFYPARAHVGWVTQLPVLLAVRLGVLDLKLLATIQSLALFALPAGLYHLALARVRGEPLLLAIVLTVVASVYLPTSFFIIGEYNAAYAAVTAAMAVVLTSRGGRRDGAILVLLGALPQSYEAMVYLDRCSPPPFCVDLAPAKKAEPRSPACSARSRRRPAGGALVSGITMAVYLNHPHFVLVRARRRILQNLQFVIPLVGLGLFAAASLVWPRWLLGSAPVVLIGFVALLLIVVPWLRPIRPEAFLFPPSHYVARTAAGCVLWTLLVAMWIHAAFPDSRLALLACLRRPEVGRRLAASSFALVLAAAVPDLALTHLWRGYLGFMRQVVISHTGIVRAADLPMNAWPNVLFSQEWTLPALSATLRTRQAEAIVVAGPNFRDEWPFDPACGTLPRLYGLARLTGTEDGQGGKLSEICPR